ncbi:hypothetical protein CRUP_010867 [Coryphaenoides rupestris]|nr:hypothetical protein CRUP_010867 [Coryphaenoides rupestris]
MQPPPRKVRVTQELKQTHAEQLSRLHVKHQTECDLLEDLRTFSQKKAAVDRDYAQALQKLANQYLKKEWPDVPADEKADDRNMYCVWRAYLEGTVQLSQSRISACDVYKAQVTEPAKAARLQKDQDLRKCVEQLSEVQAELQESVKELTKSRKKYQETEVLAQAVREKAELEAKSKLSLFQSRSSLQRASVKLKAKRSECNSKASHARNDYLLTLSAANAHQQRYYETDLMDCIKVLDGRIHEQVKDYLVSMCQTELDTYQVVHVTFNQLLDSSKEVLQEFHQQLFVQRNQMFHKAPDFLFQPSDSDTALEEYGGQESSEQNHMKAEARLDLLRQAGVAVETWLKSAMNQVMEELENERWANLGPHDPSLSGPADFEREDEEEMEDSGEALDDSSSSPSSTLRNYPLTCKVLYSYKSSQPDELTIEEQEVLEVIDDGDMDDWVKARNRAGQVGYVPEKYLQLPSSNSLLSMLQSLAALDARSHSSSNSTEPELELPATAALYDYAGQTEDELSFPEGAIIRILRRETREDDGFWEGELNGVVGVFPAVLVEDLTAATTTAGAPAQQPRPDAHHHHPPGLPGLPAVRAAPPPPKQHPRGQVKRREEVEITLV